MSVWYDLPGSETLRPTRPLCPGLQFAGPFDPRGHHAGNVTEPSWQKIFLDSAQVYVTLLNASTGINHGVPRAAATACPLLTDSTSQILTFSEEPGIHILIRSGYIQSMARLSAIAITFISVVNAGIAVSHIIEKDIAILGAGASGTYAAVRLREDYNNSIVVIEKNDHIGGHVNTYIDPDTNEPVDYGVLSYWDYGPAKAFFARMNVEIMAAPQDNNTVVYVDHETAKNLTSYITPAFPDILQSLEVYGNESKKYSDFLLPGYWNFPAGDSIPSDLLLPFGEYAEKYHIEDTYPTMQIIAGIGVGGVRDIPTLYTM